MCYAVEGENQFHCIFGGNSCYIVRPSDTAPALVALEATVHIAGPKGRRKVTAGDFHVSPAKDPRRDTVPQQGEIVTGISLPRSATGLRSSYRKVRRRAGFAVSPKHCRYRPVASRRRWAAGNRSGRPPVVRGRMQGMRAPNRGKGPAVFTPRASGPVLPRRSVWERTLSGDLLGQEAAARYEPQQARWGLLGLVRCRVSLRDHPLGRGS